MESWAKGDKSGGSPAPSTYLFSPGQIYNLGTGTGYSVLQMVQAMEKASGRKVDLPCPVPPDSSAVDLAPPTGLPEGHCICSPALALCASKRDPALQPRTPIS